MASTALVDQDKIQADHIIGLSVKSIFLCVRQNQFHGVIAVKVLRTAAKVACVGLQMKQSITKLLWIFSFSSEIDRVPYYSYLAKSLF